MQKVAEEAVGEKMKEMEDDLTIQRFSVKELKWRIKRTIGKSGQVRDEREKRMSGVIGKAKELMMMPQDNEGREQQARRRKRRRRRRRRRKRRRRNEEEGFRKTHRNNRKG